MNRDLQRQVAVLKIVIGHALEDGVPSLGATIHVPADTIEYLERDEVEFFKDYPARERRRMASVGHALPDGSFPIADCEDAEDAIRAQGRAAPGKRGQVRAHIRKRVRALRCSGDIFDPYK